MVRRKIWVTLLAYKLSHHRICNLSLTCYQKLIQQITAAAGGLVAG
jgi:hypothetical protein